MSLISERQTTLDDLEPVLEDDWERYPSTHDIKPASKKHKEAIDAFEDIERRRLARLIDGDDPLFD